MKNTPACDPTAARPMGGKPPSVRELERDIQTAILRAYATRDDLRLWRSNCGAAETATGRILRFGIPGQADLSGIIFGSGRRLEIECKSPDGRLRKEQKAFGEMIERFGGVYLVARSVADVAAALDPLLRPAGDAATRPTFIHGGTQ